MGVGTASFLVIVLFVVHEFEEIIRVVPWIARHGDDPRCARDTWIARRASYPSTEVIAAEIAEEIVLFAVVLGAAILAGSMPVVLAIATINGLHLIAHVVFAVRVRAWNPGSVTAAVTLPLHALIVGVALAQGADPAVWAGASVLLAVVFGANLLALHRLAPALHGRLGVGADR